MRAGLASQQKGNQNADEEGNEYTPPVLGLARFVCEEQRVFYGGGAK
jgi:hypothetical protein